ncbi:hypothetical protein [Tsuneonella rigui]|uniref:hypothetical protein n=1 Tax=Tsuneonella rigui TaxID=1708790 RepID=UPI000F7DF4DD|nr:hypothetical protein [Tsuneonella rigui]
MRTLFITSALTLAAIGSPAFAQATDSDTADVAIEGNVTPLCVLGEPSQASINLGNLIATSGTRVGKIRTIANQSVTLPASFCNFAGSVASVSATALVETANGTTAPPTGFARAVNYTAVAGQWGGGTASATTAATASGTNATTTGSSSVQQTPRQTDLTVDLSAFTAPGDGLLVSGSYSGLVRVTLGPAAVTEQ